MRLSPAAEMFLCSGSKRVFFFSLECTARLRVCVRCGPSKIVYSCPARVENPILWLSSGRAQRTLEWQWPRGLGGKRSRAVVSNLPAPDGLHGLAPISLTIDSMRQIGPGGGQILVGAKGGWESWLETTAASSPAGHFPTPFLLEARAAAADCWFGKVRVSPPVLCTSLKTGRLMGRSASPEFSLWLEVQ